MGRRWQFFTMPFKWLVRGCFDWQAAYVAWRLAINPNHMFGTRKRRAQEASDE